jgi:hypothetical protein
VTIKPSPFAKAMALACFVSFGLAARVSPVLADDGQSINLEKAEGENLATAMGHYARARSLILAAIREFDKGIKLANPQILLDVKEFRNTLVDRAEDLERVIAPQPKATRKGVQFAPDSRLLSEDYK